MAAAPQPLLRRYPRLVKLTGEKYPNCVALMTGPGWGMLLHVPLDAPNAANSLADQVQIAADEFVEYTGTVTINHTGTKAT